jgi:hypothetical protein
MVNFFLKEEQTHLRNPDLVILWNLTLQHVRFSETLCVSICPHGVTKPKVKIDQNATNQASML